MYNTIPKNGKNINNSENICVFFLSKLNVFFKPAFINSRQKLPAKVISNTHTSMLIFSVF